MSNDSESKNILLADLKASLAPQEMIDKAEAYEYDDFKSESVTPIHDLVLDAKKYGLSQIAKLAMGGKYDGTSFDAKMYKASLGEDGFGEDLKAVFEAMTSAIRKH